VRLSKKEKYSFWNITLRFPKGKNIGSESKMNIRKFFKKRLKQEIKKLKRFDWEMISCSVQQYRLGVLTGRKKGIENAMFSMADGDDSFQELVSWMSEQLDDLNDVIENIPEEDYGFNEGVLIGMRDCLAESKFILCCDCCLEVNG
ncbi:hypothetical protein, partial [Longirhabdus pacifica]|uniref:hypothetical protein n=1 Tax=Longirhabdus pacifica TaxID=2305227 RepID=UPI00197E6937